ncbi:MAG: DUF4124 domain-containing protein [Candidatus Thiodiazotropha endolucinida]|nr:DUF4124 domain-containing protein [Candidatus Thiodiazotropha endolucinida]
MDRRNYYLGLIFVPLLLLPASPAQAAMYKWYDEQGKLNYTQSPSPPGSRRATINSDSFSTVNMRKLPTIKRANTTKRSRKKERRVVKKR